MTKEEARKIVEDTIKEHGVVDVSDEYMKGFNDGIQFMSSMVSMDIEQLLEHLNNPPHVDR